MHCSIPASTREASFVGFRSYSGVARLFVCITVYKQPCHPYLDSTTVLSDSTDCVRGMVEDRFIRIPIVLCLKALNEYV